jgi:hypothetical protein
VQYQGTAASTRLRLGQGWHVRPNELLLERLKELVGPDSVRMLY